MEEIKQSIIQPFSNPIFIYKIPYNNDFRNSLINECTTLKDTSQTINPQYEHRQVGWQSKKILFTTQEPNLKIISSIIDNAAWASIKSISPGIDSTKYNLGREGWININQKGTLHFPHIHGNSTLSGVFYVKVPKIKKIDNKDISKPGFIEFLDPRNDVASFSKNIEELATSLVFKNQMLIEPEEGTLLIFPAWLKHWVYPNNENEERISISFNIVIASSTYNNTI